MKDKFGQTIRVGDIIMIIDAGCSVYYGMVAEVREKFISTMTHYFKNKTAYTHRTFHTDTVVVLSQQQADYVTNNKPPFVDSTGTKNFNNFMEAFEKYLEEIRNKE